MKIIETPNPWDEELVELENDFGTKVAKEDKEWLEKLKILNEDVFKNDLKLNLFPEPYIGHPDAPIYLLNGNPGFHENDERFIHDVVFRDAIKKTLTHDYINHPECGDFLYLNEKLKDKEFNNGIMTHPGYKWWTDHLGKLNEIIKPCPKVFNIEFFPYHSRTLDNLKKYFKSPYWPSFDYTRSLVLKAIKEEKIIVVMRLKKYWYGAVPGLKEYKNVIELKNPQSVYITEKNVQFGVEAEALCKATWGELIKKCMI